MVNEKNPTSSLRIRLKPILGVIALVAVAALVFQDPLEARATFSGGGSQDATGYTFYIPNNYTAAPGDSSQIEVRAGVAMTNLTALDITFGYVPTMMSITSDLTNTGDALSGKTHVTSGVSNVPSSGTYRVVYSALNPSLTVAKDAILFHLQVSVLQGATGTLSIWKQAFTLSASDNTNSASPQVISNPTLEPGSIVITGSQSTCTSQTCNAPYGACSLTPPYTSCVCKTGYDPAFFCGQCISSYTGYPDCVPRVGSDCSNLILTLAPDAINKLNATEQRKAYSSAYVIIKDVVSDPSQKLEFNGKSYDLLYCSTHASTQLAKVEECAEAFAQNIQDSDIGPGLKASLVPSLPGVVKVESPDVNGSVLGLESTSADVVIVPAVESGLTLDPNQSYQTRVIGFVDNSSNDLPPTVRDLLFSEATLVPNPVGSLKSSALAGGILQNDTTPQAGTIFAKITNASSGKEIDSNQIAFNFTSGPIIDYAYVLNTGSLERGGTINMGVKAHDSASVQAITDITTVIARSQFTTADDIDKDPNAKIFSVTKDTQDIVQSVNSTATASTATASSSGSSSSGASSTSSTTSASTAPVYKIYTIPVAIPNDPTLTDGPYKLALQITDSQGLTADSVIPITIGAVATGDVSGDGKVDLMDVAMAFAIMNGTIKNPTDAQVQAADFDKNGKIDLLDVVTLFNMVNNK
jgi:Dockerin type I domain